MPTIADIKDSIRIPSLIKDKFIRGGQFTLLPNGDPVMYTGGFTAVFPVLVNNVKWAFRCWHSDIGNVKRRMELISEDLKKSSLPFFCDFAYVDEGIIVNGKVYPTTRMRWIEGITLKEYLCSNKDKRALLLLADNFLAMCRELHKHHLAHGDLQHGNIMVSSKGDIQLIDYDSMYVPSMADFSDIITGLRDYQHPNRKNNHYSSEKLDYFSELIIYISILAIAERPEFIHEYKVKDSEMLLFSADDYNQIKQSAIYSQLQKLGGIFPMLLLILEDYLGKSSIEQLEPFDILLDRLSTPPVIKHFKIENGNTIYKGDEAVLTWEVENYTNIYLNKKELPKDAKTHTERPTTNTTFYLEVINGLYKAFSDFKIKVVNEPNISFKLSSNKISKGANESTTLKWYIQNALEAFLVTDEEEEKITFNDKRIVSPNATTTYTLKVIGLDGIRTFTKNQTLYVLPKCSIDFKADKLFTLPNVPIVLSWYIKHAKSIELKGYGNVNPIDNKVVEIEKDTEFELKVQDPFGIHTKKLRIRLLPLPVINSIMVPTPEISTKVIVQANIPNIHATIPQIGNLSSPVDASRLKLPTFEGIKIEMKGMPTYVSTPQYHILQLDIGRFTLWNKLRNKFKDLTTHLQNIKYK